MKKEAKGKYFKKKGRFDLIAASIFVGFVIIMFLIGAISYIIDFIQNGDDYTPSLGYGFILKSSRAIMMGGFILSVILGVFFHLKKKKKERTRS